MDFSMARQRFYQAINQPHLDLAKAALYIAAEEYPGLNTETYLDQLDSMAAALKERLLRTNYPLRVIQTINRYLFEELKFQGNTEEYYDPRNSYLNQVIERRTGIPITLSLIYLELAERINFPMVGVNMPGHFLIRPAVAEMEIFVDPFHGGEVLFTEDCQSRLNQIFSRPVELRPEFFVDVNSRQLLARLLGNLKVIYLARSEIRKALAAIDRILLLFPDSAIDHRDRGILYYQAGQWTEARHELEIYLAQMPTAEDVATIQALLRRIDSA